MWSDDFFYKVFLEELNSLEMFRMGYISRHRDIPLDKEDPEIRRLIEALAFFSARIRLAGQRSILSVRRRLFQQFFPYLMTPLPSMAVISANPTGRLTEIVEVPSGFELVATTEDGRKGFFKTLFSCEVLPAQIERVYIIPFPNGYRLFIKIKAFYPIFKPLDRLSIFINHLNDFEASLKLYNLLEENLLKVSVSFEEKISETIEGIPCRFSFGSKEFDRLTKYFNPIEQERLYFHFPWQDLYLNIYLSEPRQQWESLFLIMDLSSKWPQNFRINKDVFNLFAIPIINLWDYDAEPIFCDGTKESFLIQHPEPEKEFELHSIKGVYEIEDSKINPIKPGLFSPRGTAFYEVEERVSKNGKRNHYLYLTFPDAFERPRVVNIEARWFQPWFSSVLFERIHVMPYRQMVEGISWDLVILPISHLRSSFWEKIESFLHLLTLVHKSFLEAEDILDILSALGSVENSPFKSLLDFLENVRLEKSVHGFDIKHIYWFKFSPTLTADPSLLKTFITHVQNVLDAWLSHSLVELKLESL